MAQRVHVRNVTCPAITPASAPIETDCSFPPGEVVRIEVVIPFGHSFLTGIGLAQSHNTVVPVAGDPLIIGDDDRLVFEVGDPLRNGSWTAFTYNTDAGYAHTWQVRFYVEELRRLERPRRLLDLAAFNRLRAPEQLPPPAEP